MSEGSVICYLAQGPCAWSVLGKRAVSHTSQREITTPLKRFSDKHILIGTPYCDICHQWYMAGSPYLQFIYQSPCVQC